MSFYDDIVEFHRALEIPIGPTPTGFLETDRMHLRLTLMTEEWEELKDAMDNQDVAEIAKECADLIVTILGTAAEYGLPFNEVWAEVHRSNMAKAGGPRREDGKILKPEGWTPPDIASVVLTRWSEDTT